MSKQRKTASAMSVCQFLAAGATGTAMVGLGVLLTIPPDKPAPTTAEVNLTTTEAECEPDTPGCESAALGASVGVDTFATLGAGPLAILGIGSGGWLIGDGLDALVLNPLCESACVGGNGGLLGGSGGDGAFGGAGGNAGLFWGSGGDGGDGLDAVYNADGTVKDGATAGGAGGRASFLFGNGGPGGDGGDDINDVGGEFSGAFSAEGGDGGRGGLLFGDGGTGGDAGYAEATVLGTAVGGGGGSGGDSGFLFGNGGDGGGGGIAVSLEKRQGRPPSAAPAVAVAMAPCSSATAAPAASAATQIHPTGTATGGLGGLGGDARVGDGGDGGAGGWGYTVYGRSHRWRRR